MNKEIGYTHYIESSCLPGHVERCVIISNRNGIFGKLFGNVKIQTESRYAGWVSDENLIKFEEENE